MSLLIIKLDKVIMDLKIAAVLLLAVIAAQYGGLEAKPDPDPEPEPEPQLGAVASVFRGGVRVAGNAGRFAGRAAASGARFAGRAASSGARFAGRAARTGGRVAANAGRTIGRGAAATGRFAGRGAAAAGRVAGRGAAAAGRGASRVAGAAGRGASRVAGAAARVAQRTKPFVTRYVLNPLKKLKVKTTERISKLTKQIKKANNKNDIWDKVFDAIDAMNAQNGEAEATEEGAEEGSVSFDVVVGASFDEVNAIIKATYLDIAEAYSDLKEMTNLNGVSEMTLEELKNHILDVNDFVDENVEDLRGIIDQELVGTLSATEMALSKLVQNATGLELDTTDCAAKLVMITAEEKMPDCHKKLIDGNKDLVSKLDAFSKSVDEIVDSAEAANSAEELIPQVQALRTLVYGEDDQGGPATVFLDASKYIENLRALDDSKECGSEVMKSAIQTTLELDMDGMAQGGCADLVNGLAQAGDE